MARGPGSPWGTRPERARGLGSPVAALCAGLFLTLASLPTPLAAERLAPAALTISEVMPAPQGNLSETEGEWIELEATSGGALDGIAITDFDGPADFVFPAATVEPGERIVVANGATAPPGVDPAARLFFAGKTWWTWDNAGDDVSLLSPEGSPTDRLEYGEGAAVDPPSGPDTAPAQAARTVPPGASFGRVGGAALALVPTPGAPNEPLSDASSGALHLAAVVLQGATAAPVVCRSAPASGNAYLWSAELGEARVSFGVPPAVPWGCVTAAALGSGAEARALGAAVGGAVVVDPVARPAHVAPLSRVALVDPWGAVAFERPLPPDVAAPAGATLVLLPCDCPGGWRASVMAPAPTVGVPRPTRGLEVLPAGGALRSALTRLVENATDSLDVNAYLMNSDSLEEALRDAAARGVHVRLLLEGAPAGGQKSRSPLDAASLAAFNNSGVWVRTFRAGEADAARDHAKYLIVDGRQVAVLTENLVGAALSDEDPNIGYGAFCTCRALARDLAALFGWDFERGEDRSAGPAWTEAERPAPQDEGEGDGWASLLLSPAPTLSAWEALVAGARSSLRLEGLSADLETLGPASPLGAALLEASRRGVTVHVLLSADFDGLEGSETQAAARALAAAAADLPAFEVRSLARPPGSNSTLHAKVLVVDGARFILGSHNFVRAAFALNREVSLLVDDAAAARGLAERMDGNFARGSTVAALGVALVPDSSLGLEATGAGPPPRVPLSFLGFMAVGSAALAWALKKSPRALRRTWTLRAPRGAGRRRALKAAPPPQPSRGLLESLGPLYGASDLEDERLPLRAAPPHEAPVRPPSVRLMPPTAFDLFERP